jgi:hypothetical protein
MGCFLWGALGVIVGALLFGLITYPKLARPMERWERELDALVDEALTRSRERAAERDARDAR